MCDPGTISGLSLGGQAAGAIVAAMGAANGSNAAKQSYEYQAAVERNNAAIAEFQAQDALNRGAQDVVNSRLKYGAVKGTQRARLAASGVDVTEGSAKNILDDTQYISDVDAATLTDNALRAAWGFRVQAATATSNSEMLSTRAAAESPGTAVLTSLLGSGRTVADSWYRYSKAANTGGGGTDLSLYNQFQP